MGIVKKVTIFVKKKKMVENHDDVDFTVKRASAQQVSRRVYILATVLLFRATYMCVCTMCVACAFSVL